MGNSPLIYRLASCIDERINIWSMIERWLLKLASDNSTAEVMIQPEVEKESPAEKPVKQPRKKPTPLPPEFRKSLRVSEQQDKKPCGSA